MNKKIEEYFRGKVILITGASGGFGRELAITLGNLGTTLCLVARREEELVKVKQMIIEQNKGYAESYVADISKEADVVELFDKIQKKYHRLDILINNAGVTEYYPVWKFDHVSDKKIMGINYHGAALCIREALRIMLAQGQGQIFVTNSLAGLISPPFMVSYNASKHALTSLVNTARAETRGSGIFFTSFHPGDIAGTEIDVGKVTPHWAFNEYRWTKLEKVINAAILAIYKRKKISIYPHYYWLLYRLLNAIAPSLIYWLCERSVKKNQPDNLFSTKFFN